MYACYPCLNVNQLDLNLYGKLKKRFDRLIYEIDFENNRDFLFIIIISQRYVYVSLNEQKKKEEEEEEEIQTTTTHILATLIRKQSS